MKARRNGRRHWFHFSDYAVENHGLDACKARAEQIATSSSELPDNVLIKTWAK